MQHKNVRQVDEQRLPEKSPNFRNFALAARLILGNDLFGSRQRTRRFPASRHVAGTGNPAEAGVSIQEREVV